MNSKNPQFLDSDFVNQLFEHPSFKLKLDQAITSCRASGSCFKQKINGQQASMLMQEISCLLYRNYEMAMAPLTSQMKSDISALQQQIAKMHESISLQASKFEGPSRQIFEEAALEDEQLFDLPSIKRTIDFLHEKIKEIGPNSSILLDSTETSKENKLLEDALQDKLAAALGLIEQTIEEKQSAFEDSINKRLQKQQKTINSILETLNDLNGAALTEKTSNTLSNSKSAVKLKQFFGFR